MRQVEITMKIVGDEDDAEEVMLIMRSIYNAFQDKNRDDNNEDNECLNTNAE